MAELNPMRTTPVQAPGKKLILLLVAVCSIERVSAQAQYVSFRIDSAIRAGMAARQIPGLQVAVVKYGLVLKKGSYGYANLEDRARVNDSTLFSIASMSKAFTDAGILLLMEDAKLDIDDPVSKYFDSLPPAWSGITIRQLMNHTSGIRDDWEEGNDFFYTRKTDSAFFNELVKSPLKFKPGEAVGYGCGPFVLGLIISKVSGQRYEVFMKERIFDKLGMTHTLINNADSIIANRAQGYRRKDSVIVHGVSISPAAQARGDVGVLTTATDMLKWYAALQDSSLLKKSSLDLMFSPGMLSDSTKTSSGFGWFITTFRDHLLMTHSGSFRTGFNSDMMIFPDDHVGIIVLCNLWEGHSSQIAQDIIALFNPDYARIPTMEKIADPDTVRTLLLRSFFTEFGLNVDSTRKMAKELHIPYYFMEEDLSQFRNVEEFNFIRAIKPARPTADIFGDVIQGIYFYEVKCAGLPKAYFSFYLNPEGKVVYMEFE